MLASLVKSYRSIEASLPSYQGTGKFPTMINTQMKVAKSIYVCISLMRNPKLQISSESRVHAEITKLLDTVEDAAKKVGLMAMKDDRVIKRRFVTLKDG